MLWSSPVQRGWNTGRLCMRTKFPGYLQPSPDEFSALWQTCFFVLDANVLLDLYRGTPTAAEEAVGALEQIRDRLWLPYQVALEYQRHRTSAPVKHIKEYRDLVTKVTAALDNVVNRALTDRSPIL